ncbi:aldo/keto reductase [Paenibacillus filicis]|uniref:Aldo/keto reductase n=1 Tax=Paenibacillus gyeongsangnamensis TaxID=3388067 RepID=A0ABT4QGT4_9BACL|nr:aldo/keto reductase [Paenibacillus filicis]MCZ8516062.1 aldo/keto reductase [Paenibacillus filicis]MCZ8516128.1 aldo/keto reductase [Paenibacillus filicis]
MRQQSKLGLGGHTFIEQLGNDPEASFEEQCAIVSACLDQGIRLIDTTYYQERVALGKVLTELQRREEVQIMAWNFFKQPGKENDLVKPTPYEPHHIDIMLEELRTDYIDILVIHAQDDTEKQRRELELAKQWIAEGKVNKAAIGMLKLEHLQQLPDNHPVSYVLAPYNAFNQGALETFRKAKEMGLEVVALSPFIRGWKLDEIGEDKAKAAEILLRWVTGHELVDFVIVSMRKSDWVKANVEAVQSGPLDQEEEQKLNSWIERLA